MQIIENNKLEKIRNDEHLLLDTNRNVKIRQYRKNFQADPSAQLIINSSDEI